MGGSVHNFFLHIPEVYTHLFPDALDKCRNLIQAVPQKGLELILGHCKSIIAFGTVLILLLAIKGAVLQEKYCKENALIYFSSGGIKVILTLSTEVIALYI